MNNEQLSIAQTQLTLFNTSARRYQHIMPAFGPLAESLVQMARLESGDSVLDLGTGSGAVAFAAARVAARVAGIDYAPAMLRLAAEQSSTDQQPSAVFFQSDMHRLPCPSGIFQVALASLALNGVTPERVFAEVWRVLAPGGRLIFQEWGAIDPASQMVKKVIDSYKVVEASGFLADLRRLGQAAKAWSAIASTEALTESLHTAGFCDVSVRLEQETIPLEPRRFFLFRTAWTPYQAEFEAMGKIAHRRVEREIITYLTQRVGEDGRFLWQPQLMRATATKPNQPTNAAPD